MFIIRSLYVGGAERQLVALARGLVQRGHAVQVLQYYGGGPFEQDLRDTGVDLVTVQRGGRASVAAFLNRLRRAIRQYQPDIVHTYMPVPNLAGAALKPFFAQQTKLVWGIRASNMDMRHYDALTRLTQGMERMLSSSADLIVSNSHAAVAHLSGQGYRTGRMTVIPNGIDTERFAPDTESGARIRRELGIPADALLVGHVGRIDPMKDHENFIAAAGLLGGQGRDVRFLSVGGGSAPDMERLRACAAQAGITGRIIMAGQRTEDLPALYNAMDIMVSSSRFGEGFSNTVGEAMSSGVPCAVTDVGDSALIVGDTGEVAPPGNPEALAGAMQRLLHRTQRDASTSVAARARITDNFSIAHLIDRTAQALAQLINHP